MNSCNFIGRLVKNPELRYTQEKMAWTRYTLAIERSFVKKGEERQADFINFIAWDKSAEFVVKYFKKGLRVGVSGRVQTGSYEKDDGTRIFTFDVVQEKCFFADGKQNIVDDENNNNPNSEEFCAIDDDDELPFN